ncbi:hypothetical protein K443DRAFT_672282 [Laccaria amethystina LaAM-08-1]|uniref:Uncharacterized protein n=1 Tax=Laccaria amethystina LaAM-08-1 TaxID=1095629 RepID=A0A0C9YL04_9AGAR|nr:hypothetical protein K443DRAFT_672282 [Laccaria amethystina LaAM-08-1]
MSPQLVSIVPAAPLTDDVFPFNQDAFIKIREYQQKDLAFLDTPPVKALVGVGDIVGGASTAVVGGVGSAASGVASSLFGGLGTVTGGLPGGGLLRSVGQGTLGAISTADAVAQQLVDPTKLARQHYHYSSDVKNALPPVIDAVDTVIHDFSSGAGHVVQQLYENIPTQGIAITTRLITSLADVDAKLAALYAVLTQNNIQESIAVGQDKYKGVDLKKFGNQKNYLTELSQYLPPVLKTIQDVKVSFATISSNLHVAQDKINSGVTDPGQIFAQSHEEVVASWKAFEVKRKTLTYLPYKY